MFLKSVQVNMHLAIVSKLATSDVVAVIITPLDGPLSANIPRLVLVLKSNVSSKTPRICNLLRY